MDTRKTRTTMRLDYVLLIPTPHPKKQKQKKTSLIQQRTWLGGLCGTQSSLLTSYSTSYIPTAIVKSEMKTSQFLLGWDDSRAKPIQRLQLYIELEVPTIGPRTLKSWTTCCNFSIFQGLCGPID